MPPKGRSLLDRNNIWNNYIKWGARGSIGIWSNSRRHFNSTFKVLEDGYIPLPNDWL